MTVSEPILELTGVVKHFGAKHVLRGVDLSVERGEVVSIIGASGSGKSTLLRCANLLAVPDEGTVKFRGEIVHDAHNHKHRMSKARLLDLRKSVGMVFQRFHLFPHLTVLDNIIEGPRAAGLASKRELRGDAHELLDKVRLGDRAGSYPLQLSGGEQQRVAIARALAMRPEVMLFDEVTSAVDPEMAGDILGIMRDLAAEGMTMLVVTHEMDFAAEVADRVLFVCDGAIAEQGPSRDVMSRPKHPDLKRFLRAVLDRVPMETDDEAGEGHETPA